MATSGGPLATIMRHRLARRRLLQAGAATAGSAALAGYLSRAAGAGDVVTVPGLAAGGELPPTPEAVPPVDLDQPIEDPRVRAAHLLRRAGFGGTQEEIEEFAAMSRDEAATRLISFDAAGNADLDAILERLGLDFTAPGDAVLWWLARMAYTAHPLQERMTLLWHGLLTSAVSVIGGQLAPLMLHQSERFRAMALPRYDDLLQAISKDPAMMVYLDTVTSTAEHPNENYPRELMELYSMGEGTFSEDDVREAARAFTGWRFTRPPRGLSQEERREALARDEPEFLFVSRDHDFGEKTFLGQTGPWDGDDIVRIIMEQEATGRRITRRLFTELVHRDPSDETLDQLYGIWVESGHDIREIVRALFTSDEFYSLRSYRALVRSPVEMVVGAVRALGIENAGTLRGAFEAMGMVPFDPPSPAGWPGGPAWLSSGTLFARANAIDQLLRGLPRRPARVPSLEAAGSPRAMVDLALDLLVDGNVPDAARDALYSHATSVDGLPEQARTVAYLVLSGPEYQLR